MTGMWVEEMRRLDYASKQEWIYNGRCQEAKVNLTPETECGDGVFVRAAITVPLLTI